MEEPVPTRAMATPKTAMATWPRERSGSSATTFSKRTTGKTKPRTGRKKEPTRPVKVWKSGTSRATATTEAKAANH